MPFHPFRALAFGLLSRYYSGSAFNSAAGGIALTKCSPIYYLKRTNPR